jgi:vacuolar-type H+-ATPase subunit E/Vma4
VTPPSSGVDGLEEAVQSEAREKARKIVTDAETRAKQIRERAERQVEGEVQRIVEEAHEKVRALRSDTAAKARLEAQTLKLQRRENLLDQVFAGAEKRLDALVERADYADIVWMLVREGVARLGRDVPLRVHAGRRTQDVLDAGMLERLRDELGPTLTLGEVLSAREGVVVETVDGHRSFDNTLQTRLSRMREALRAPVFHILMGEEAAS